MADRDRDETKESGITICIVGAGAAGLGTLKVFRDSEKFRSGVWKIDCYEEREDIGGTWLQAPADDPNEPPPTPMYDSITANLPHPIMCYPSFWFPPSTPLFPKAEVVQDYLRAYAKHFSLLDHIRLNAKVISTRWSVSDAKWLVKIQGEEQESRYDRLVVANGHYRVPKYPSVPGLDSWRSSGRVTHSAWYRSARRVGSKVLVVGGGYSGQDIAEEMSTVCDTLVHSVSESTAQSRGNIDVRCRLVRLSDLREDSSRTAFFSDGSSVSGIDHIFLATGYMLSFPFFNLLDRSPPTHLDPLPSQFHNDGRFLYPFSRQLFPLSDDFPAHTCAFVGIPLKVAPLPLFEAQARALAHIFAHPSALDVETERRDVLTRLHNLQSDTEVGFSLRDIAGVWHKFVGREQFEYRDALHAFAGFVGEEWKCPEWAIEAYSSMNEVRALWKELVRSGEADDLVKGVGEGGNQEWVRLLGQLVERAKKKKDELGVKTGAPIEALV